MRWPRRRKPEPPDDDRDFLRAIGWVDDDGQPIPSPERAKPETPQVTGCLRHYEDCPDACPWRTPFQPITSPSGSQAWKWRMLAARREHLARRIDQGMRDALADATETITNPYAQETPMPDHLADGQPAPGSAWRAPDGTRLFYTRPGGPKPVWAHSRPWLAITSDGRFAGWLDDGQVQVENLTPMVPEDDFNRDRYGTECHEAGYARGHAAGTVAGLPLWLDNLVDAARTISDPTDTDEYRSVRTPGQAIVVLTEQYLEQIKREAAATPETGSAAWLRDLADRLQQYGELIGMVDPEEFTTTPRAIRSYADKTERQAAADTRDRERVEQFARNQWARERGATPFPGLVPEWDELSERERESAITYGLELYRAGRDDTVAAWQPGNGGGGSTRGGQPAGQGGAHHA